MQKRDVLERIGLKNKSIGGELYSSLSRKETLTNYEEDLSLSDKTSLQKDVATIDSAVSIEVQPSPTVKHAVAIPKPQPKKVITPHNTPRFIFACFCYRIT